MTFDDSLSSALEARARFYGLGDQLYRVAAVSDPRSFDAATVQVECYDAMKALLIECSKEPISSIVLGGGLLAGFSSLLNASLEMPVVDGTQAAIGMLRSSICG